ncbi:MAG: HD-GYP domain-containing protein [Chloroflexi bacterium]|nr:HD-GYP domain-containing protein [Chloroflexota bacterium]
MHLLGGTAAGGGEQRSRRHREESHGLAISLLVGAVTLGGLALMALGGWQWRLDDLAALAILAAIAVLAERFDLNLYGDSRVSVSIVPIVSAALLAGPWGLAVVVPPAVLASQVGSSRPVHKALFNFGALMLSGGIAALVFALSGRAGQPDAWPEILGPGAAAAVGTFVVNSLLVAGAVALTGGRSVVAVWREKFQWLWPHYLVLGLVGLAMVAAYVAMGLWGLAIFLVPPVMMRYSFKQYLDRTTRSVVELQEAHDELKEAHDQLKETMSSLHRAYDGTLRSLIAALDTRDSETRGHSERVADTALAIAGEIDIDPSSREWQELEWGALLHDVGKVGVPDAILRKAGKLTSEEWDAMRLHPAAGHEILSGVEFLGSAAEVVYAHHERYDGTGYPRGLAGDQIPLGARIFAVADAFDAMISDRPYRKGMAPTKALAEILENSGSQFDPEVVHAFLKVYHKRFESYRTFGQLMRKLSGLSSQRTGDSHVEAK